MSASVSANRYCIINFNRNDYLCLDGTDESGYVRWEPFNRAKAKRKKKWFSSKAEAVWFWKHHRFYISGHAKCVVYEVPSDREYNYKYLGEALK
jgi:hypothetical protein